MQQTEMGDVVVLAVKTGRLVVVGVLPRQRRLSWRRVTYQDAADRAITAARAIRFPCHGVPGNHPAACCRMMSERKKASETRLWDERGKCRDLTCRCGLISQAFLPFCRRVYSPMRGNSPKAAVRPIRFCRAWGSGPNPGGASETPPGHDGEP